MKQLVLCVFLALPALLVPDKAAAQIFTNATRLRSQNICSPLTHTDGDVLTWSDVNNCMGFAANAPGSGANTTLSNLGTTSINASLLFQSGKDVGSAAAASRFVFFYGAGTFSTTSFKITGTPTAARTITFPDASITVARSDAAQTFTGVQTFVAPILGTPTSATLTNATGLPEAGLSLTDITTSDASASKHGFLPKLSGSASDCFLGDGTFGVCGAGGGANTALSNLASVSINTSLLAQTGVDAGSTTKPFRDLYLFGSGTYATTYLKITGTPTGTRTITIPDATGTLFNSGAAFTSGAFAIDLTLADLSLPAVHLRSDTSYTMTAGIFPTFVPSASLFGEVISVGKPSANTAGGRYTGSSGELGWANGTAKGEFTNPATADRQWAMQDASFTVIGRDTSDTLTNKTIDAEGTGNVVTIPEKVWLPAAGCNNATASPFWDLPTSTPAAAACVTGSNTQKGVLDYADTSGGFSAQNEILLPADFSGAVDASIFWTTSATSGNAKWSLSTICTATGATETDDPAFNTASTVTTAAPGTANRIQTSSIASVTITGCAASEYMHVKLFRDGNDGSDTIGATARFLGLELTVRRAM